MKIKIELLKRTQIINVISFEPSLPQWRNDTTCFTIHKSTASLHYIWMSVRVKTYIYGCTIYGCQFVSLKSFYKENLKTITFIFDVHIFLRDEENFYNLNGWSKEIILLQGSFASTKIGSILLYGNYKLWKTKKTVL